jgi:hypothetical protein
MFRRIPAEKWYVSPMASRHAAIPKPSLAQLQGRLSSTTCDKYGHHEGAHSTYGLGKT